MVRQAGGESGQASAEDSLAELASLAGTAGAQVAESQIQSRACTGCHAFSASIPDPIPTRPRYQNTMDMLLLRGPSVRTVSALSA